LDSRLRGNDKQVGREQINTSVGTDTSNVGLEDATQHIIKRQIDTSAGIDTDLCCAQMICRQDDQACAISAAFRESTAWGGKETIFSARKQRKFKIKWQANEERERNILEAKELKEMLDQIIAALDDSELDQETRDSIIALVEAVRNDPSPGNLEVLAEVMQVLSDTEQQASDDILRSMDE